MERKVPENAILVSIDITSLYTNIPQGEGRNTVCQAYELLRLFSISIEGSAKTSFGLWTGMKNELPQKRLSGRLHLCRHTFASVWGACFDALTHVVICVSSAFIFQTFAEVCYSIFVKRSTFKTVLNLRLLKVYYRSVFNESSKAFIFQKFAESLHPE